MRKNKNTGISLQWSNEPYLVSIEQNRPRTPDMEEKEGKVEKSLNIYPLKEGKTLINGTGEAGLMLGMDDIVTEIDLNDPTVKKTHCCLQKLETKVYVQPINGCIQVNNRVYEPGIGQVEMCSGDFLVVGEFYLFQYQSPGYEPIGVKPKGQVNLVKLFKMLLLENSDSDQAECEAYLKVSIINVF